MIGLPRQLAAEYGPERTRVNTLCPDTVPTCSSARPTTSATATAPATPDEALELQRLRRFPLGRLGEEDDIGYATAA